MSCCQVLGCTSPKKDVGLLEVDIAPVIVAAVLLCRVHRSMYEVWYLKRREGGADGEHSST